MGGAAVAAERCARGAGARDVRKLIDAAEQSTGPDYARADSPDHHRGVVPKRVYLRKAGEVKLCHASGDDS